ncbi:MAG: A24 family peptidase [Lapillicoccus sp.]
MSVAPAVPAPWWLVAAVTVAGAGLGWLLAHELGTGAYRLDDEADRRRPGPPAALALAVPVLWGVLAWRLGGLSQGAALPAYLLLAWTGAALFWVDVDVHRLPEGLTLPVIPALLVLLAVASATTGDWGALLRAVVCGVAGWVVYAVLAFIVPGGLGLGDATLGGLVALPLGYLGWGVPIVGFVAAYLASGVVALVGLATRRLSLRSHIAFGPFIVIGALVALLLRFQLSI